MKVIFKNNLSKIDRLPDWRGTAVGGCE